MTTPTTHITHRELQGPTTRQKAVMDRLTALHNNHRLAIHMVESTDKQFAIDDATLNTLATFNTADIAASLRAYDADNANTHPPFLSMSLLPAATSGWSMAPYNVGHGSACNYGYLVNLSQGQDNAPKVVRARHNSLASGTSLTTKDFQLSSDSDIPTISDFYAKFRPPLGLATPTEFEHHLIDWKNNLIRTIGGHDGSSLTEAQLDILGNAIPSVRYGERFGAERFGHNISDYNEILVASNANHIAAITVPVFNPIGKDAPVDLAKHRLQAALIGLDHLARGITLPVVLYHVSAPHKGELSYVGQSQAELKAVAKDALMELKRIGEPNAPSADAVDNNYHDLFQSVERHLGKGLLKAPAHAWFDRDGFIRATNAQIRALTPPSIGPTPSR